MLVGVLEVELLLYEANSLKEKRHIIKSLIGRISSRFNVSISEVASLDMWNKSTLGVALVGNDSKLIDASLSQVINFIDNDHRLEIIELNKEII